VFARRTLGPDIYAVLKPGGKRAVRLFESENEALAFAENSGGGFYVQNHQFCSDKHYRLFMNSIYL